MTPEITLFGVVGIEEVLGYCAGKPEMGLFTSLTVQTKDGAIILLRMFHDEEFERTTTDRRKP